MIYAKAYIGSKNVRRVLFGAFLVVLSILITTIHFTKESLVSDFPYSDQTTDLSFDSWNGFQLTEYLKWPNHKACERVGYFGEKILKNNYEAFMDGQKAVCLDIGTFPLVNCLIYSIGINDEWDFDEAMESYGCQVYAFDPTMDKEEHDRSSKIHFYPIGLGARNEVLGLGKGAQITSMNNRSKTTSFKMMTLSSIYRMLSPIHGDGATIDYLKFDIEGGEWNVIPELIESGILDKVRQLGIEIHLTNGANQTLPELRNNVKILHRLEKEGGMVRFDSKPNGISRSTFKEIGNMIGYYAYEMAWYNKKYRHD